MFEKILLASSLLVSPVSETNLPENTEGQVTDDQWEQAKDTVIEWTTDNNANGIPDKFEELFEQWKNTELVGGITIGAIATVFIGAGTVVLFFVKLRKKFNKAIETSDKATEEQVKQNELILAQTKEQLETIKTENESLRLEIDKLIEELNKNLDLSEETVKVIKTNSKYLKNIDKANARVKLLLSNQLKMACNTNDLVSKGVAKELKNSVEDLEAQENDEGTKESV